MRISYFLLLSVFCNSALAAGTAINCTTSSSGTTLCDSQDPGVSIVPFGASTALPQSSIVVKSPNGGAVDLKIGTNSKAIKNNLFVSNGGSPVDINVDLAPKWDPSQETNGLTSAANGGNLVLVSDIVGNLSVNVNGYVGKSGKSSAQICAERVLGGVYGSSQADLFKKRCNDGSTGAPCVSSKIRSLCDQQDVSNIQSSVNQNVCPAGYDYLASMDNNPSPTIPIRKLYPKPLVKCERDAFLSDARRCLFQEVTCTYRVVAPTNRSSMQNVFISFGKPPALSQAQITKTSIIKKPGYENSASRLVLFDTSSRMTVHSTEYNSQYGNTNFEFPLVDINITFKETQTPNSALLTPANFTCPKIELNQSCDAPPGEAQVDPYVFGSAEPCDFPGISIVGSSTGELGSISSVFGNDRPRRVKVYTFINNIIRNQERLVDYKSSCMSNDAEYDTGVLTKVGIPSDTQYYDPSDTLNEAKNTCPGSVTDFFFQKLFYKSTSQYTDHNLTSTFANHNGVIVNPLTSNDIQCSNSTCSDVPTLFSTSNVTMDHINLGAGEVGSAGGNVNVFAFSVQGSQNYSYDNGLSGINGSDNLAFAQVKKNCALEIGDGSLSPVVKFHETFLSLFAFNSPSQSQGPVFPLRNKNEAIHVFQKVSPGIRALIKEATCPSCN